MENQVENLIIDKFVSEINDDKYEILYDDYLTYLT